MGGSFDLDNELVDLGLHHLGMTERKPKEIRNAIKMRFLWGLSDKSIQVAVVVGQRLKISRKILVKSDLHLALHCIEGLTVIQDRDIGSFFPESHPAVLE
jgi:hypothetical protein